MQLLFHGIQLDQSPTKNRQENQDQECNECPQHRFRRRNIEDVLKIALTKPLKRVDWVEVDQISKKDKPKKELSTH